MSAKKSREKAEGQEGELTDRLAETLIAHLEPKEGIERELRVIRVGPNPRMIVAEYWELAERRTCVVRVGDNRKWLKGMSFKMREPIDEAEYRSVWNYRGRVPRRKGRW